MDNALTQADLEAVKTTMGEYDCAHWGLRVVDSANSFDAGELLPNSRRWVDGEPTEEFLNGTSCLDTQSVTDRLVAKLTPYLRCYAQPRIMLIGGDEADQGEDEGELVIRDAFCYWHKVVQ